jgi:ectoine hydroxylase
VTPPERHATESALEPHKFSRKAIHTASTHTYSLIERVISSALPARLLETRNAVPREDAMKLTPQQIEAFEKQGYLFFPNCFAEEEVALLRSEAEKIFRTNRQEVWREKTGAPRTAFAAHTYNEAFRLMAHHPRLVEPLQQLFGEGVYVHQFKINAKAAFEGDVWQWHQDYGTWARDDGMPEPRAMNISVFLDEVLPINGPLMVIPKSHKYGTLAAGHDTSTTSYPLWTLDAETVTRLCAEAAPPGGIGIVAPTGKPGSVLMFHGNLVHASPPNITPYPRKIVYLTLCAVSNHITKFTRPEWIAHRDFTPIVPVDDDALIAHARAHRVAAE